MKKSIIVIVTLLLTINFVVARETSPVYIYDVETNSDWKYPDTRGQILDRSGDVLTLSPASGYLTKKFKQDIYYKGRNGIQAYYNEELSKEIDLFTVIAPELQKETETILDEMKLELNATEVLAMVMHSQTGDLVTIASTNRYDPTSIKVEDISNLSQKFAGYLFEPSSVMMPFTVAMNLNTNLIIGDKDKEVLNTNFQKFHIGENIWLQDDVHYETQTITDVLVNSSNIGIVQLAWQLSGSTVHYYLNDFGFGQKSGIDLESDLQGKIKSKILLEEKIHRATSAYGYGLKVTPIQLLKAYSMFSNNGIMVTPHIGEMIDFEAKEVLYKGNAHKIKQMLIEIVNRGTGQAAKVDGLTIGGKTGTAHIVKEGKYINAYNSSFYGFVEDDQGESYTIGVLVINAKNKGKHFASLSAVPTFKKIVQKMIDLKLLIPNIGSLNDTKEQNILLNTPSTQIYEPLIGAKVIKLYGKYKDPVYEIDVFNESVTLQSLGDNEKVFNVLEGKVVFAGKSKTLGNVIVMAHHNNFHTVYAGLKDIAITVKKGKWIEGNDVIGRVEKNLIFQVIYNDKPIDPIEWLKVGETI